VHDAEALSRGVDFKQAWDAVNYVDLEDDEDFCEKAEAIRDGIEYDTRVSVPLTVPDDVLFELMKRAHEQDITLNQLVEQILWTAIEDDRINRELEETRDNLEVCGTMGSEEDDDWDDDCDEVHFTNTDNSVDFPVAGMKAKKKKKKK